MSLTLTDVIAPSIDRVIVTPAMNGFFGGSSLPEFHVDTFWSGVDRPSSHGFAVPTSALAERLKAAIEAGRVFIDPHVKVDVRGLTYVESASTVHGKWLESDLRDLGF